MAVAVVVVAVVVVVVVVAVVVVVVVCQSYKRGQKKRAHPIGQALYLAPPAPLPAPLPALCFHALF